MSTVPHMSERRNTGQSQLSSINTSLRAESKNPSQQSFGNTLPFQSGTPGNFTQHEETGGYFSPGTMRDYDTINQRPPPHQPTKSLLSYALPNAVASVKDGWQGTSSSGAVVSGLLAGVASQLLGTFTDADISPSGAKGIIVATCYAAIFLNINATIGSFVLIDRLGELGFEAARLDMLGRLDQLELVGHNHSQVNQLLKEFGAGRMWKYMLIHWLVTFYLGILSLIISVLTYVLLTEGTAIQAVMCVLVGVTLVPTTVFILFGGRSRNARKKVDVSQSKVTI
ncbi:hypothetical protein CPB83DRAFT_850425 [Crepidotus variabilis]|uniref:Uncharacterized protein n=1 Tax=Crepidotus variabilis TaxID=179855 RepID=A0A9P6EK34_9AGAR|nr:hypothetical protein CPB83DRAFT_850425 [Crepidotus variabilis]